MSILFAGFGVDGFKSFGSGEMQFVGPMKQVHLVVGKNNVGKSNALTFMSTFMSKVKKHGPGHHLDAYYTSSDLPTDWPKDSKVRFAIGLHLTRDLSEQFGLYDGLEPFHDILRSPAFSLGHDNVAWFKFALTRAAPNALSYSFAPDLGQLELGMKHAHVRPEAIADYAANIAGRSDNLRANFHAIVDHWAPWSFIPAVKRVDAVREITHIADDLDIEDQVELRGLRNGRGLIHRLAAIQHPTRNYDTETAKFDALQNFVRSVLDDPKARVEIPTDKTTIFFHTSEGRRSIEELGTGISEIVVLAAMATGVDDKLICIEEPEAHLHPTVQRKLIEYLQSMPGNTYLIATHSAQLLNADVSSITHTTMPGKWTQTKEIATQGHLSSAVFDLGNRASDLVQSNFLVWVEGPTDRMYIAHWLRQLDPELVEGAHFSIMFYGGGLLNHLSAEDQETKEFIELLTINRNLAIVIDSDVTEKKPNLNETKVRVIDELKKINAISWVTAGYTVENYFSTEAIQSAVDSEYPTQAYVVPGSQLKSPLSRPFEGTSTKPSKVMIARRLIASRVPVADWSTHLVDHVRGLSSAIRTANDLPPL